MENSYFRELSRRLRLEGVESDQREDQLDILLRGEPVFYVSPASDVFLLPAGSNDLEVSELYHQVAVMVDEVQRRSHGQAGRGLRGQPGQAGRYLCGQPPLLSAAGAPAGVRP